LEGQRLVATEDILTSLNIVSAVKIRELFKGSPAWARLLSERNGMCGFCLQENADALQLKKMRH
jgi:hypothetical protein